MYKVSRSSRRLTFCSLILVSCLPALSGCCGVEQQGRCGMPDLCDPVVLYDPLPEDKCVPAKGVDCGHYGFRRTSWRVFAPQDAQCCGCIPGYLPTPIPSEQLNSEQLGSEQFGAAGLVEDPDPSGTVSSVSNRSTSIGPPSYARESVNLVAESNENVVVRGSR